MSKVILEGYVEVSDADLDLVKNELVKHIELTKSEKGCVVFKVEQENSNRNRFSVYEEFESEEAFRTHQTRAKDSQWGVVTKNVKRNYNIKRV